MEWPATGGFLNLSSINVSPTCNAYCESPQWSENARMCYDRRVIFGWPGCSKYNTRVVYFPVLKWHQDDDPLNDPCFPFYEGYFIEHVCKMLKKGKAMPSIKDTS